MICERALSLSTSVAVMLSVARVTYIPFRVLAVNVIAIHSRSRRNRRKPDSTTTVEPVVGRLYSPDELLEMRRNILRYARASPPGNERNQHRQVALRYHWRGSSSAR
jgi:hypothetical protein